MSTKLPLAKPTLVVASLDAESRGSDTARAGWLRRHLVAQFRRPSGLLGRLAGWVMSHRASNVERNRESVRLLDIQPTDRVLELGFGPGLAIAAAAERATSGHVHGLDHSATMVRMAARRNAAAIAEGRVTLQQGGAEGLALAGLPYDKIFAVNVDMFWPDRVAVLRKLREHLAPGGHLALTHQPRNRAASARDTQLAAERMAADLEAAGFRSVETDLIETHPVPTARVYGVALPPQLHP